MAAVAGASSSVVVQRDGSLVRRRPGFSRGQTEIATSSSIQRMRNPLEVSIQ